MVLLLLASCRLPADVHPDCPELRCHDRLSLRIVSVEGGVPEELRGTVTTSEGRVGEFECDYWPDWFDGGRCTEEGAVELELYSSSLDLVVEEGWNGPSWEGTLTPAWTAPQDTEGCPHTCWFAEVSVQLEP